MRDTLSDMSVKINEKQSPETTNKRGYYAVLSASLLIFIITTFIAARGVPYWEEQLFRFMNNWQAPEFVTTFARISSDIVWAAVLVTAVLLLVKKYFWGAWKVAVPAVASYVFVFLAEHVIGRARPEVLLANDTVLRASQDGMGFPSGHAATMAAIVAVVWLYSSWRVRTVGVILLLLVSWSRVYLGVHFPLDVFTGMAVGVGAVCIVRLLPQKIRQRFILA